MAREESSWRELEYLGLEFKRVSAAANVLWAVGGDHEVGGQGRNILASGLVGPLVIFLSGGS